MADPRNLLFVALAALVLLSAKRTKGFPAIKAGHVYRVTVETSKSDQEIRPIVDALEKAYGENWQGYQRIDETHIQWTFVADQDEPAPGKDVAGEWVDKTTVDDLGPRVLV